MSSNHVLELQYSNISYITHACNMPHPSNPPLVNHPNN